MSLPSGSRVGAYEVVSSLGVGGMGEVYRARDTRLGRDVAVKVLLESLSRDPELLARFEREARLLASLNHPHLAQIYGLEGDGHAQALIMELVEGPTLAERIARGPLPLDEALSIARQIAEALEAAHEQGIIHRDLKPANIKIRPDGAVKVLDFGLAKLADSTGTGAAASALTSPGMTRAGVILGTPAYMSPEQARGQPVDARVDIWAFGCVCYEMLTGRRTFDGETASDAISAVLTRDPAWAALPEGTPAPVHRLLRRCLARDVTRRLRHAGDVRLELDEIVSTASLDDGPATAKPTAARGTFVPWAITAIAAVVAMWIGSRAWQGPTPPAAAMTRLELSLPAGVELFPSTSSTVVASPDGRAVAFVGTSGGSRQLFLRRLDEVEFRPLRGTTGATTASFSLDAQSLVFVTAAGELKTISLASGLLATVTKDASLLYGVAWAADDEIVFTRDGTLWAAPKATGEPRRLTTLDKDERLHAWPSVLPDGRTALFTIETSTGSRIDAVTLATGARQVVLSQAARAKLGPGNQLFFYRDERLLASAFDPAALHASGTPIPVLDTVADLGGATPVGDISVGGLMVFAADSAKRRLVWVSRDGVEDQVTDTARAYLNPRVSPDGTRIVVQAGAIWIHDLRRKTDERLTTVNAAANAFPMWLPGGTALMHRSGVGLRVQSTESAGEGRTVPGTTEFDYPGAVTSDLQTLLFLRSTAATSFDVLEAPFANARRATPLVQTPAYEGGARLSADQRWIVYVSNESEHNEVYVRPFRGAELRQLVSTGGGSQPAWHPNGREIFYRTGDRMMAVRVTAVGNDLQLSPPTQLFDRAYAYGAGITIANYDVAKDGRFVMVKDDQSVGRLRVTLNWHPDGTSPAR